MGPLAVWNVTAGHMSTVLAPVLESDAAGSAMMTVVPPDPPTTVAPGLAKME